MLTCGTSYIGTARGKRPLPPTSPTLASLEFAIRVRTRRRQLGLAAEVVSKALEVSRVYYSAIENNRSNLSPAKLATLLKILEFSESEGEEMAGLLRDSVGSGWWGQYGERVMSEEFAEFVGLEHGAKRALVYEGRVMTGLLQTRDYATEIIRAAPEVSLADAGKVLDIRMRRQFRLFDDDPIDLEVILSEAVLMQQFGGRDVLRGQLQDLAAKLESSLRLEVRIQPFARTPMGLASASTLVLLEFESPHLPVMAWREAGAPLGITYDDDTLASLRLRFDEARRSALNTEESMALIRARIDQLAG